VDSVTERSGQTTFYYYDQLNRLTSITDTAGGVTTFGYDGNGNRTSIVDPRGNATTFTYDSNNRLVRKTYADGTYDSFTYRGDFTDILATRINARGITTNFSFSNLNLLSSFLDVNGPQTQYYYDSYGRMTSSRVLLGTYYGVDYTYDANSRITSVAGPWKNLWSNPYDRRTYQYDALGRRTAMTLAQGVSGPYTSVSYNYDTLNRLTGVNVGGQNYTYTYAGASPLVQSLTRPDGSVTTYEYDILNRLTLMTARVGETVVNSYAYTYNEQDLRGSETATEPEPMAPYADALMNYEYNNVNALLRLTDPGEKLFTYDATGNLTQGYTPEGYAFTAAYNGSNQLTSLTYTDGEGAVQQSQYAYLGSMLIWKKDYRNSALVKVTRYTYDGDLIVQERDAVSIGYSDHVAREFTWGLGLPGGIGGLLRLNQGGADYSYLFDGKGNATSLLDSNANVVAAYQYDPFGNPRGPANSLSQPMQFSTKPYDEKTGLSYYGYRFYVPSLGRWLTRDPIGEEGGINLYEFVGNDPINYIDPDGLVKVVFPLPPGMNPDDFDIPLGPGGMCAKGANTVANKLVKAIANRLGMSQTQRQLLHRAISKQNFTKQEIEDIAEDILKHFPKKRDIWR